MEDDTEREWRQVADLTLMPNVSVDSEQHVELWANLPVSESLSGVLTGSEVSNAGLFFEMYAYLWERDRNIGRRLRRGVQVSDAFLEFVTWLGSSAGGAAVGYATERVIETVLKFSGRKRREAPRLDREHLHALVAARLMGTFQIALEDLTSCTVVTEELSGNRLSLTLRGPIYVYEVEVLVVEDDIQLIRLKRTLTSYYDLWLSARDLRQHDDL